MGVAATPASNGLGPQNPTKKLAHVGVFFGHLLSQNRVPKLSNPPPLTIGSIFEHCPVVWRPSSESSINRLESVQKRSIKWINKDLSSSYSSNKLLYFTHCRQLKTLPVQYRFDYHDLKLLHLIVHNLSFIKLPPYLHFMRVLVC